MSEANEVDGVVITQEQRTDELTKIARSYLVELQYALESARTCRLIGAISKNETLISLDCKIDNLQNRVNDLIYKLKRIDAL